MPKGVMWRHVDLFFGAMGGAGGGGAPIRTPEEIAERCARVAHPLRTRVSLHARHRPLDGVQHLVHGRHRAHPGRAPPRPARVVAASSSESTRTYIVIVGDAFAPTAARQRSTHPGHVGHRRVVTPGRRCPAAQYSRRRSSAPSSSDCHRSSSSTATARRRPAARDSRSWSRAARSPTAPRFRVGDDTQVLGSDLRPGRRRRVGRLGAPRSHPVRLLQGPGQDARTTFPVVDGVRWAVPGDHAGSRGRRHDHACSAVARPRSTPAARRCTPDEVESVLKAHPDVFDALVVGVPDERWGERVVALVQARTAADRAHAGRRCKRTAARISPGTRCHARWSSSMPIERSPSGKPDYRWARATATRTPGTVEA